MQLLSLVPEERPAPRRSLLRAFALAGGLALGSLPFAPTVAASDPTPTPTPTRLTTFDATIDTLSPTSAPDGGVLHVTGRTSCTETDVILRFYTYDGRESYEPQQARIVSHDRNGRAHYAIDYVIPAIARPGRGLIFAYPGCGNPDAYPSPEREVTITKAPMRLVATGARTVTVAGTRCYGDADGKVTVRSSRGSAVVAALKADRFTARFTRTPGPVTFSVVAPDCTGSHPASVRVAGARSSSPGPSRSATPPATPSQAVSPTASVRPSPSAPSLAPSSSPATVTADRPLEPASTVPWLLYGLAAAVLIGGTSAGVWRARR